LNHTKSKLTAKRVAASRNVQLEEHRLKKEEDIQGKHSFYPL
jgi:hypothetical protein